MLFFALIAPTAMVLPEPASVPFPEEGQKAVMALAEGDLFDAESARWRWPDYVEGRKVYCGYLNAKNRMGAYVGFKPFMVYLSRETGQLKVSDLRIPTGSEERQSLLTECAERGALIQPF